MGKEQVLPQRKVSSVKEFFEAFPEAKEVFIDGTERPIRRPKDNEAQRNNYSGKKKRHTKKNIVICEGHRKIGFLGKTTQGKEHDFSILKSEEVLGHIPKDVIAHCDLGFPGIQTEFPAVHSVLPQKKPLRIVSDVFRNRVKNFDDLVMLICSGLWNYHLA